MIHDGLRVTDVRQEDQGHTILLSARMEYRNSARCVSFHLPAGGIGNASDAVLVCNLLPAMHLGATLHVPGEVSSRLLTSIKRVQEIYHCWDPTLFRRVTVEAASAPAAAPPARGVATFFTGGVDSFFTLLRHLDEITHIIYIWGFDVLPDNPYMQPQVSRMLHEVAAHYGKTLLEVKTDLRSTMPCALYGNLYTGLYSKYSAGPGLAAIGTLLSSRVARIYVPASHTYAELFPWSSHPLVDPLWSSEAVEFVHDGADATRFEKTRDVAQQVTPLQWLRVCMENRGLAYNCGRCEKCLRTMVALRASGMLQQCTTFQEQLSLWRVMLINTSSEGVRAYVQENLTAVENLGTDPALARALRIALAGWFSRGLWKYARRITSGIRTWSYNRRPANCRQVG